MEKRVELAFGKKQYLLGSDDQGVLYWLEEGKWSCDWYWSLGYVETFTINDSPRRSRDISSHQHFDGLFFYSREHSVTVYKSFFKEHVLSDKEIWTLMELMHSLYTLKSYSNLLHRGFSGQTTNECSDIIKNNSEYERINKVVIPAILEKVYAILSPVNAIV